MISNAFSPIKKKPTNVSNVFSSVTNKPTSLTTPSYSQAPQVSSSAQVKPSYSYSTPTQPKTIQYAASGMGSQFASNPSNYVAPTPKPAVPPPAPSVATGYMNTLQQSGDAQKALAEKMRQDNEKYVRDMFAPVNAGLDQSAQASRNNFNAYKADSEAGIQDIQTQGETQKSNAKDYYGDAQLQAAKSRDQVRGQTQRTFSNLNTIDSRGEGSFAQATENQDSAFNSFTQGNLKAQAQKLTEIDMQVSTAVRAAKTAVLQEESKLNEILGKIEIAKSQNNTEMAKNLVTAYNESQQRIYDIQDGIDNIKHQYQLEQEKFKQAQDQLSKETAGLSPEFLQNGQVKTMQDFIYRSKHPELYDKVAATSAITGNNQNKALTMVNGLLTDNSYDNISGLWQPGNIPVVNQFGGTGNTAAQWDGLKNLLTLAGRGQLKGSGQVSDFETKMLEKAALAGLDPSKQTPEQFKAGLQQLQQDLMSGGATATNGGPSQVRVISPDGQVGMIDSSELQQALASGWRQQ